MKQQSETDRLLSDILDKLTSIETLLQEQNVTMTEPDDEENESESWRDD